MKKVATIKIPFKMIFAMASLGMQTAKRLMGWRLPTAYDFAAISALFFFLAGVAARAEIQADQGVGLARNL